MNRLTPRRLILEFGLALVMVLVLSAVCSLIGSESIHPARVIQGPMSGTQPNMDYEIFVRVRLPRIAAAGLIGSCLAVSGVILQALLRNPLADPFILGISSGAALGTVLAILLGLTWVTAWGSPISLFALIGALATVGFILGIAGVRGKRNPTTLLLSGVVVNAFLSAVILFLTSITKGTQLQATIFWLMGNLNTVALQHPLFLVFLAVGIVTGLLVMAHLASPLNVLCLSPEMAQTVGVSLVRTQCTAFLVATLLTSLAVSVSGLIGFVGLIVPHAVRLLIGPDHRKLIPLSALVGGGFLIVADTIARVVIAPAQLPVGIITALLGGPFFLVLLLGKTHRLGNERP